MAASTASTASTAAATAAAPGQSERESDNQNA
jgi:hypothetical protein